MSSGLPQATKSRKFTVERDKDSDTLYHFHTDVDVTVISYLGVPRLSMSLTIVFAFIGSKVPHDVSRRKTKNLDLEFQVS